MRKYVSQEKYRKKIAHYCYGQEKYFDILQIRINGLAGLDSVKALLKKENLSREPVIRKHFDIIDSKVGADGIRRPVYGRRIVGFTLHLTRPELGLIKKLIVILERTDYTIKRAEVTLDLLCETNLNAYKLLNFLCPYFVVPSFSRTPSVKKKYVDNKKRVRSVWFKLQNDDGRYNIRPLFKVYILEKDNPKHGYPACHMEFRFNDPKQLSRVGIRCLTDLVNLDFSSWYRDRLYFMQVNRTKAGGLLRQEMGKDKAAPQQNSVDFKTEFSGNRFLAHNVYHWQKDGSTHCGLQDSLQKWKSPWA